MTDHTPGPWHVIEACYEAYRGSHSIGSVDVRVAKVARNGVDDVEGEANARLIAAAPDLLEACVEAIQALDAEFSQRITDVNFPLLRAAVAKATGGP